MEEKKTTSSGSSQRKKKNFLPLTDSLSPSTRYEEVESHKPNSAAKIKPIKVGYPVLVLSCPL
jgi:hypothetical protein